MPQRLPVIAARPRTRADCIDGPRPCPWAGCRYHLLLDVTSDGRLRKARPFDEDSATGPAEALVAMPATCALDVVDARPDGLSHDEIAQLLGVTDTQIYRDEARALHLATTDAPLWREKATTHEHHR